MAEKGWTAQVAAAAGVAAGTGAAQLGLGYGLGVVEWPATPADNSVWLGSLGWATWIAASATVFGAVIAGRLGRTAGGPWRFTLAASAAVGALLTVALIAVPARAAVRTDTFSPQTIAGGYAVIGVLLGLVIAYWAVVSRPVAANLIATAAWLWSLAAAAVVATIFWHRPSATYLSSWQFVSPDNADGQYGAIDWPAAALTLLAALAVGITGALPAVRRGDLGVGAACSGAVGPLLVAAAFFVLAPQLTGAPSPLQSAYLIAPYAVLTGLAGSALTVALGQRWVARRSAAVASGRSAGPAGPPPARTEAALPRGSESPDTQAGKAGGAGNIVVPSSRPAPAVPAAAHQPTAGAVAVVADPEPQPHPRRSFMDRIRRKGAAQASPSAGAPAAAVSARGKSPAAPSADAERPAPPHAESPAAPPADAASAVSTRETSPAERSTDAPGAVSTRGRSPGAPPADAPKSRAASVDGGARPAASSTPGRSDSRSTVAPPPDAPPIAKINDPQSGEKRATSPRSTARANGGTKPGPTHAANSDKTPPAPKNTAKSTKPTPAARPAASRQATSPRSAAGRATSAKSSPAPDAAAVYHGDDADTAELPVLDPENRGARRPGEDETR